jgi:hypothetical protein
MMERWNTGIILVVIFVHFVAKKIVLEYFHCLVKIEYFQFPDKPGFPLRSNRFIRLRVLIICPAG